MSESKNTHKKIYVPTAIAIIVIVLAAFVYVSSKPAQTVASGDTVGVYYTGMFQNGTVFNSNVGQQPLQFIVGSGQMIPGFDNAVIGMTLNETKNVTLTPTDAYGYANPNLIISVPISAFGNHTVTIGMPVSETAGGQQFSGIVTAMNASNVLVDFNPPLAGKTLLFSIKVVSIQKKS